MPVAHLDLHNSVAVIPGLQVTLPPLQVTFFVLGTWSDLVVMFVVCTIPFLLLVIIINYICICMILYDDYGSN